MCGAGMFDSTGYFPDIPGGSRSSASSRPIVRLHADFQLTSNGHAAGPHSLADRVAGMRTGRSDARVRETLHYTSAPQAGGVDLQPLRAEHCASQSQCPHETRRDRPDRHRGARGRGCRGSRGPGGSRSDARRIPRRVGAKSIPLRSRARHSAASLHPIAALVHVLAGDTNGLLPRSPGPEHVHDTPRNTLGALRTERRDLAGHRLGAHDEPDGHGLPRRGADGMDHLRRPRQLGDRPAGARVVSGRN